MSEANERMEHLGINKHITTNETIMKNLKQYIKEKLIINKDYKNPYTCVPTSCGELRKIIEDRYNKFGRGTKNDPIDFNDVDVSNVNSFYNDNINIGIFEDTNFEYIDISGWNVSNVKNMVGMFYMCEQLKSIGDITKWDVSNVSDMLAMFYGCASFNQDISGWDVSNVTDMSYMFYECKSFNQDLSKWNVSNVTGMAFMFSNCISFNQDLSKWNVSKVGYNTLMFYNCPIKEEYKPKFKQI